MKRKTEVKQEEPGVKTEVKEEVRQDAVKGEEEPKSLSDIPTAEEAAAVVKTEAEKALAETSAPTVVFKKRKKAAK
jgi:hypothetical protein